MEQVTVDQVVQETLFEKQSSRKSTWKFCNQITLPRSEVVFFVQMFVILMLIVLCIVKLTVLKPTCEETSNRKQKILTGNTFYPKFKNVSFLYHEMQPIYSQVDQHSNIVFKKFTNLEFLQNTENCLLIFDDSLKKFLMTKSLSSWLPQVDTRTIMSFM